MLRSTTALLFLLAASPLAAQDNYEIQVYPGTTVPRGVTMLELHSNFTSKGSLGAYGSNHALHETIEITHGFNNFFEIGFYQFLTVQPKGGLQYVGNHIRPRFAIPEKWNWPVGLSLSQEVGYVRTEYAGENWSWEIRPIIDKRFGKVYAAINPTLGIALSGPGKWGSPEFEPQMQVGVDVSKKLNIAVEYYGVTGTLAHSEPFKTTGQYLFPAINVDFGPDWEFNLGTGIPLNSATDRVVLKMILGRKFGGR